MVVDYMKSSNSALCFLRAAAKLDVLGRAESEAQRAKTGHLSFDT